MVALAEPKKRTKWTLNPRGKLWSNDESKLGQKLLEKMGWSKGKGLGKAEQGEVDPIRVNYKMDSKGMGFKGNNDEWVANKEGFDSLLGELKEHHVEDDTTPSQPEGEAGPSRPSLEVRSKHSRARVHYHKHVRGKDLSRYSEDDLACILGNKKTKATSRETEIEETTVETEAGTLTKSHGVTTIQGGNLNAYFASKMAKLTSNSTSNSASNSQGASDEDVVDETEKPVKKTRKSVIFNEEALVEEFVFNKESPVEKKKKRKKTEDNDATDDVDQEPSKKKKKLPTELQDEDKPEVEDPKLTKKKKKRALSPEDSALEDSTPVNDAPGTGRCEEDGISEQDNKTKKKKKKKDVSYDLYPEASEIPSEISEKKQKKKKTTKEGVDQEEEVSVAKKKSKSEKTVQVSIEGTCSFAVKEKRKKKAKYQPETIEGQVDNNINEALENLDGCLHDNETLDASDPSQNSSELGTKKKKKKKEDPINEECTESASSKKGKKKKKSKNTSENFNQRVPFKLKDFLPKEEKPTEKPKTEAPAPRKINGPPTFEYLKSSNIKPEAMYKIKGLYQQARFDLFAGANLDSIRGYGY